MELSYLATGRVNWYNHFRKLFNNYHFNLNIQFHSRDQTEM